MENLRTQQIVNSGIECLAVSETMIRNLQIKADGIKRSNNVNEIRTSVKCCPTSHGCTGATNCDCAYGDYHNGH